MSKIQLLSPRYWQIAQARRYCSVDHRGKGFAAAPVRFVLDRATRLKKINPTNERMLPAFWELFCRQFLSLAGMALRDHQFFPPHRAQLPNRSLPPFFRHILVSVYFKCLKSLAHHWTPGYRLGMRNPR
jgi:hypothetical protein